MVKIFDSGIMLRADADDKIGRCVKGHPLLVIQKSTATWADHLRSPFIGVYIILWPNGVVDEELLREAGLPFLDEKKIGVWEWSLPVYEMNSKVKRS